MSAWLRTEARCTPSWASQRVRAGRLVVDSLPRTRAAWQAGDLNFEHVQVIRRATKGQAPGDIAALDRALAAAAPNVSPTGLSDVTRTIPEHLAPDTAGKERDEKTDSQSLHLSNPRWHSPTAKPSAWPRWHDRR